MGEMLQSLRRLQAIENELAEVRRRLRSKSAAIDAQAGRLEQLRQEHQALHDDHVQRQKQAAAVELELKSHEQEVARLRLSLNTARTNKEYAAILTHINTIKADNSKLEDEALRALQEADKVHAEAEEGRRRIQEAEAYLEQVRQTSAAEVAELEARLAELRDKRASAAAEVPPEALSVFDRIASTRDGDAMARIEVVGDRPPYSYVCGGCNMSITAEHANALRTRDELRFCDLCGRILYLDEGEGTGT